MNRISKCKSLVTSLISIFVISLGFNVYLGVEKQLYKVELKRKDKAITEIRNTIKTIAKTYNTLDSIQIALKKDFYVNPEITYSELDSSFSFITTPKDWNKIDHHEIWTFYGLEIIFDKQKKFQEISFYKP